MALPVPALEGFAEQLLAVIDEGRRTATYKLALLIALIDCCAENTSASGEAPAELSTSAIARRMAEVYWPQLRPFEMPSGAFIDLRQITNKSSTILRVLKDLFDSLPLVGSWSAAERLDPVHTKRVLDVVELTTARYPLVRLQTVDGVPRPFLYDVDWGENVRLATLQAPGGGRIRFRERAGDQLLRLAPLLRPLIELHWIRMVGKLNELDLAEDELRRHLFGVERSTFPAALRVGLRELQSGMCLYCARPLTTGATAVDHFVPWSRWPNDAVENLVLAHTSCNTHKSDHVPGTAPLALWADSLGRHSAELRDLAVQVPWSSGPGKSLALVRTMYAHLLDGSPVWDGPGRVTPLDRRQALALLTLP